MLPLVRALLLAAGMLAATSLAYPTWWLGAYNFRCKPPYYVESFTNDWGEWRVSSVCAPGTCCSNWANTGPLCTADACGMAETERARLTTQHNAQEVLRKKKQKAEEAKDAAQKAKNAEMDWKKKEALEDVTGVVASGPQGFSSEWDSKAAKDLLALLDDKKKS